MNNVAGTEIVEPEQLDVTKEHPLKQLYRSEKADKYAGRIATRMMESIDRQGLMADTVMAGPFAMFDTKKFRGCEEQEVFKRAVERLQEEDVTARIYKHSPDGSSSIKNWVVVTRIGEEEIPFPDEQLPEGFREAAQQVFPPLEPQQPANQ